MTTEQTQTEVAIAALEQRAAELEAKLHHEVRSLLASW